MRLIIVRHGQTVQNAKQIVQGQTHGNLSKKGIAQAKKIGAILRNEKIDIIYSSDLGRAVNTTKEIAKYHEVLVYYTKRIRERHAGVFHGRRNELMKANQVASNIPEIEWRPKGGESFVDLRKRVKKFSDALYKKHADKSVLLVTHGLVIKCLYSIYFDVSLNEVAKMRTKNTGLLIIDVGLKKNRKIKDAMFELQ